MSDSTKVHNFSAPGRKTNFEELLDSKKAGASLIPDRPLTNEQIPDYIPRWDGTIEKSKGQAVKGPLFKRVKENIEELFRPAKPTLKEVQLADAKKVDLSVQQIGSRPYLQKPSITASQGLEGLSLALEGAKEKRLIKAVGRDGELLESDKCSIDEESGTMSEAEVERSVYEVQKRQVALREQGGITLKDNILCDSIERKRLWNIYSDLLEEAREKAKDSKIFDWISIGAGVVGAAVMIGSLVALAVATGGLALPALLAVAGGIAAIAGGGAGISSAIFKHQGDGVTGQAFVNRHKQAMKKDEILAKLQDLRENNNSMVHVWSNIAQLLRNSSVNLFR